VVLKYLGLLIMPMVAVVVLSGCSSSHPSPTPSHSGTPSVTASRSVTAAPIPTQHSLPPASKIPNDVALRRQVQITSCTSKPGGWQAKGTATNTGSKTVDLTITVFFTTTKATVLDYATTKVQVPGGASKDWTASADFAAEPTMRCVLRGVG
jgi:hypothetical protein